MTNTIILGQSNDLRIGCGIGSFDMKKLAEFQNVLKDQYPVQLETVDNFDPYYTYSIKYTKSNEKYSIGILATFSSTGTRSGYRDYSGYIYVDQMVKGIGLGPLFNYSLCSYSIGDLYINIEPSFLYSIYSVSELFEVQSELANNGIDAKSYGGSLLLGSGNTFSIGKFMLGIEAGYSYNFYNSNLKVSKSRAKLSYYSGTGEKDLKVDWSGIRGLIFIGVRF